MRKRMLSAVEEVFLVGFFLVAISLPLGLLLIRGEGKPAWENRRLAELPTRPTHPGEVYHLPRMLTEYFKDHFALRADLIRRQASAKVNGLRTSSSPEVMLGKDGWLFHKGEGEVEMFTGAEPFTAEGLEDWRRFLEAMRDWAKRRGATFVVTFVPEKQTIYSELMPDGLTRSRVASRQDQLIEYLKRRSDVRVVDLRPALMEAKAVNQIYYRTDTHWNELGVFAAYQTLLAELSKESDALRPMRESDFEVARESYSGDLAGLLGLYDVLKESRPRLRLRRGARASIEGECRDVGRCASKIEGATLPRVVMYRDSASSYLIPLLAEHFGRGVYVWDRDWKFSNELLEAEHPDVLILEMVERRLMQAPPNAPRD
jgi:hypothetical protein